MSIKQKTIAKEVSISGVGLHTGLPVTLTFKPAPANHGFAFQRVDIEGQPIIKAQVENVVDISRGTTLEVKGVKVATIEHCLAALVGADIDNVLIEVNNEEVPILDGSSKYFTKALKEAGAVELDKDRIYFEVTQNIVYKDEARGVELLIVPCDHFKVSVMIDYNSPVVGCQHASLNSIKDFESEISTSRTFVFLHELEYLVNNNLIKGGDLNNAIVFVDKVIDKEEMQRLSKIFDKPNIRVEKEGILNNTEANYQNEAARHKLLDIIGDLALVGMPFKGHVIATKPGHASNIEFAKLIKKQLKLDMSLIDVPKYDPNATPVYDVNQIKNLLPHRYPFLLVDKVIELSDNHVVGVKNVTVNETFFLGHFPSEPVMPGVLQVEAMAQAGGIFTLSKVPDPENYITYFMKIDNVRFKNKVVPGDTLIFKLTPLSPFRRGISHMQGTAYVGNKVVMEAELMAQIVKK